MDGASAGEGHPGEGALMGKRRNVCRSCGGEAGWRDPSDGTWHPCHQCSGSGRIDGPREEQIRRDWGEIQAARFERPIPIPLLELLGARPPQRQPDVPVKGRRRT